jgi:hypothetical protein
MNKKNFDENDEMHNPTSVIAADIRAGGKLEGHKNLTSIKGIGPLTGSILLSVIGDIHDFADEGKLAACFGIVSQISNSNETERSGRITKRGNKLGPTAAGAVCSDCAALHRPGAHRPRVPGACDQSRSRYAANSL